ncbi:CopG family transcriptional regulator [Saccharomonospora sp. CUA-673]|nr:CopG family transcriptional regulator [Saccharomonospora sp. CUA-673]OLT49268.1 CopG family transcriptional regulator [Saccharomonospora sp. CUA-673]
MEMTLRLTAEQGRALTLLAAASGISRHDAAVRAISEAAARMVRADRVRALSCEGRTRYVALLDRFAQ